MDRQKLLLIFGAAWVSAALLTWFLYSTAVAPKTEKTVPVVVATHDMPAGTKLRKSDLRVVQIPEKSLPKTAVLEDNLAVDRVLLFPINTNEPFTAVKLTSTSRAEGLASTIEPGMRAVSVPINDTSGAGGLVMPRSHVDVLFTRPGSMSEAVTSTIVENVMVMSVGRATEVVPNATIDPRAARPTNQAATLLVTPEQAKKIELAKNEGKISLSLRNPLDSSEDVNTKPTFAEALNVGPLDRKKAAPAPNMQDPRNWAKLAGEEKKEPPPRRAVIDVFRGEKHVQEVFQ
jgi:pilus assembly protein CpaB